MSSGRLGTRQARDFDTPTLVEQWVSPDGAPVGSVGNDGAITGASLTVSGSVSGAALAGSLLSAASPLALGGAAPGTGTKPAREDHVHPTTGLVLTSGAQTIAGDKTFSGSTVMSGSLAANSGLSVTGNVTATGTIAGSGLAGSLLSSATPLGVGAASPGTSTKPSREDHVHPASGFVDTSTVQSIGGAKTFSAALTASAGLSVTGNVAATGTVSGSGLAGSLLSSSSGAALGGAAAGSSAVPARSDHVHPTTGLVLDSGTQTVGGAKTFSSLLTASAGLKIGTARLYIQSATPTGAAAGDVWIQTS